MSPSKHLTEASSMILAIIANFVAKGRFIFINGGPGRRLGAKRIDRLYEGEKKFHANFF